MAYFTRLKHYQLVPSCIKLRHYHLTPTKYPIFSVTSIFGQQNGGHFNGIYSEVSLKIITIHLNVCVCVCVRARACVHARA